jgi:beta-lactamase regulating signal transducer with metallopeptidase domain
MDTQYSLLVLLGKATLILVAAIGITRVMQRASAGARHLVWLVTLGVLLLVPALTTWGPIRVRVLPAVAATATVQGMIGAPVVTAAPAAVSVPTPAAVPGVTPAAPALPARAWPAVRGVSLVVGIWAAIVALIVGAFAWSGLAVRRIVRHSRPLDGDGWVTPLVEIADRMGLDATPRLVVSSHTKMPFACGVFAATIVLPEECDGWSLDRRRAVLLHELAHVRRRDLLGHLLGRLVCAVYWFHPLVWMAATRLRSESERACDDLALACGTRATDYAEHLLDIVTAVRRDATPTVALAMARRKEFEGRMLAILDPELRHSSPSRRQSVALIGSLALLASVVAAAAPVPRQAPVPVASAPVASVREREALALQVGTPREARREDRGNAHTPAQTAAQTIAQTAAQTSAQTSAQTTGQTNARINAQINAHVDARTDVRGNALPPAGTQEGTAPDDRPVLLAKVLRTDTSAALRRIAAWGLAEYAESPVAVDALVNAVRHDRDGSVREMAAWTLAASGNDDADVIAALSTAVRGDADGRVRKTATWALGTLGASDAAPALAAALADTSDGVRSRAVWALGTIGAKDAPPALGRMLRDKDARTRELAAWALYEIRDPASLPALEAAFRTETDEDVQLAYVRAIAVMGESSVSILRGLIESPDSRIKTMAVRALAGGNATGPWPWPWPEPRPSP